MKTVYVRQKDYEKLTLEQFKEIKFTYEHVQDKREEVLKKVRITNHKVRLLHLLKQVYGELSEIKEIKNDKVLRMISSVCELKAFEV